MTDNIILNVKELNTLSRDLKRVDPALQKEFLNALKKSGNRVALAAKAESSRHSSRIPKTIKVRRAGVRVRIVAGGEGAPHAAAFEHQGHGGTFRHPVFGRRDTKWATQKAHPFLTPAATENFDLFVRDVLTAVDSAFYAAGFHG